MVTKDSSASDSSYGSSFKEVWSKKKRDMVLKPKFWILFHPFASKYTGFSLLEWGYPYGG